MCLFGARSLWISRRESWLNSMAPWTSASTRSYQPGLARPGSLAWPGLAPTWPGPDLAWPGPDLAWPGPALPCSAPPYPALPCPSLTCPALPCPDLAWPAVAGCRKREAKTGQSEDRPADGVALVGEERHRGELARLEASAIVRTIFDHRIGTNLQFALSRSHRRDAKTSESGED